MKKIFIILSIFLFIFSLSQFFFNKTAYNEAPKPAAQKEIKAKERKDVLSELFPLLNISLDAGGKYRDLIESIMLLIPYNHLVYFRSLVIESGSVEEPRGLGGARSIIIRPGLIDTNEEFAGVFIHELGHVVDLGGITGSPSGGRSDFKDGHNPIFKNDPSIIFYNICWEGNFKENGKCRQLDYVSGYAMSDPFEDFAESFLFYMLHNREFRIMSVNRPILREKYNFIRDYVFYGKTFNTGRKKMNIRKREWDATLLPADLDGIGILSTGN